MKEIHRRPALEQDKQLCREIHHAAFRDVVVRQFGAWDDGLQDEFFDKDWAAAPHEVLELDGKAVGAFSVVDFPDHILLNQLQILPEYQGKGLGSSLLRAEMKRAAGRGVPCRLQVLRENEARGLYERLGFTVCGMTETHSLMEWRDSR